jgi:biopolymer transport protein ExbD
VAFNTRNKRRPKFRPPALMLTSMMDMFTIILLFLLVSFSDAPEKLELNKDLELPTSTSKADFSKAVKLILSKKELRLNNEVMATVQGKELSGLSEDDPESSALYQRLKRYREEAEPSKDESQAPHVLLLCDKSHSFKTINRVIKAAGLAGYPNFQFAVLEEQH